MFKSIRTRILAILCFLLLAVVCSFLFLADRIFRQDKQLLVFDNNRSTAERTTDILDSYVKRVSDRMDFLSQLITSGLPQRLVKQLFDQDPDMLSFDLITAVKTPVKSVGFVSEQKQRKLNLTNEQMDLIRKSLKPKTLAGLRLENRSIGGSCLYLIQIPVQLTGRVVGAGFTYAQAILDGQKLLRHFQGGNISLTFAITQDGKVFAHPDLRLVVEHADFSDMEIVRLLNKQTFTLQQTEFDYLGKRYLGLYRRANQGSLSVISITEKATALAASQLLLEKTFLLALIIITMVVIVSVFLARSISAPLLKLISATSEIAKGQYDSRLVASSDDEIGVLTRAFSGMAQDLKNTHSELQEHSRLLEKKVADRTRELETKNIAIQEQQEALLRTARLAAVGETAGQTAHEVLNPLTAIIARLETVEGRLEQFFKSKDAPMNVMNAIVNDWKSDFDKLGFTTWVEKLKKPSDIYGDKTLGQEDLDNLTLLAKEFEELGDKLLKDFSLLSRESHRISRIIEEMQGLARSPVSAVNVDISEVLRESIRLYDPLLSAKGIKLENALSAGPFFVKAIRDNLLQVFVNLIKNSLDAILDKIASHGQQEFQGQIKVIGQVDGSREIVIRFLDNGCGIKQEIWSRIFQINFTTKGSAGSGIGLSISRRLIQEIGGELRLVSSEIGKFTEFEIRLPLVKELLNEAA